MACRRVLAAWRLTFLLSQALMMAMLLPRAEAVEVAERMARVSPAPIGVMAVSIGLAQADAQRLIDRSLYEAKHGGQNRIGVVPAIGHGEA